MATELTPSTQVTRIVEAVMHGKIVATMTPEGLCLRKKGTRKSYLLPWGVAFTRAAMLDAHLVPPDPKKPARSGKRVVSRNLLSP